MAMHELAANVVPKASEITDPVRQWQRELDGIHAHFNTLKQADKAAFEAEKIAIADAVRDKRDEHLGRLKIDIHQYMRMVQEDMDTLLAELQTEKLRRLDDEFEQRQKQLDKERDHHLLHHLNGYRAIADAPPPDKPVEHPRAPEEHATAQTAKVRTPLPADRRSTPQKPDASPAFRVSGFQAVNGPRRKVNGTENHVPEVAMAEAAAQSGLPGQNGSTPAPSPRHDADVADSKPNETKTSSKRRASEEVNAERKDAHKRPRTEQAVETPAGSAAKDSGARRRRLPSLSEQRDRPEQPAHFEGSEAADKRTISFDEVYQNGQADYKHAIVEFPQDSNKWYILRCDQHGVHFGKQPLLGAAKHLHSTQHSNLPKHHALAIELLGHLVFDCDKDRAEVNNAVVNKAFAEGYTPYNVNRLTRTQRLNQGLPANGNGTPPRHSTRPRAIDSTLSGTDNPGSASQKSPRAFTGLTNPVAGELYLGYWTKTKSKFAIMVLPLTGDLGATGVAVGTLYSIGLVSNAPRCFNVNKATHTITGWAKGYEDGGPLVTKREFPVVYFDHKHQVGWLPVRNISQFDFEDPKGSSIPEFYTARDGYARHRGYESYAVMKADRGTPPFVDVNGGKDYFAALAAVGDPSSAMMDVDTTPSRPRRQGGHDDSSSRHPDEEPADAHSRMDLDDNDSEDNSGSSRKAGHAYDRVGGSRAPSTPAVSLPKGARVKDGSTAAGEHREKSATRLLEPPKTAQEIAARALHLSPDRDTTPSARAGADQTAIEAAQAATAVMAFQAVNAPTAAKNGPAQTDGASDVQPGPASRASKIQDLLGADISPVRHRPTIVVGDRVSGFSPNKSLSPTTNTERPKLPARAPSAQPILDSIAAAPRKVLLGGPTAGSLDDPEVTVAASDALLPQGKAAVEPVTSQNETVVLGGTAPAGMPAKASVEGASSRSASLTPLPRSATGSPKVAAAAVPNGEGRDRWKAVRNASSSGSPPPSTGANPSAVGTSASTPKDATMSPLSATASSIKADPDRGQDFDIVAYHGDSRRWSREAGGPYLRLSLSADGKRAETGDSEALHVTVDPHRVANMVSEATDATGVAAVEMTTKEGSRNRQRLVFETKEQAGRLESGKLQARRFCQWVLAVNPAVLYRPNSDAGRRLSTQGTQETPVTIE